MIEIQSSSIHDTVSRLKRSPSFNPSRPPLLLPPFPGLVKFPIKGGGENPSDPAAGTSAPMLDSTTTGAAASSSAVAVAFSQPSCCAATAVAALSYATMAFLMSPTPLAMRAMDISFSRVSHVIMTHMVGMYAPSVLTGKLVGRFGWSPCAAAGSGVYVLSSLVMHAGTSFEHFVVGQMLLGVAWNLCFVSSTSELARCSLEATERVGGTAVERARGAQRIQGYNDVIVFAAAGAASVSSGAALASIEWKGMQVVGWCCAAGMAASLATAAIMNRHDDDDDDDAGNASRDADDGADGGADDGADDGGASSSANLGGIEMVMEEGRGRRTPSTHRA